MKSCFKCGEVKPLTEFYRLTATPEGARAERKRGRDKYWRLYAGRPKCGPRKRYEETRAWRERNPEKRAAHGAVANALRTGALQKSPCEVCGDEKVEGHHPDYSRPLDVRWLCRKHHAELHRLDAVA